MMSGHIKMKDKKLLNIAKDVIKLEFASLKKLHSNIGSSFEKIIKTIVIYFPIRNNLKLNLYNTLFNL